MATELFVTRTKLIVPQRRKEMVTRSRLMDLLSDLLDYRLIIIAAPAGYGKTSLMIDFASQFDWPVCWYALEPLDSDLQRFLTHFIHSIRVQFPEFGGEALAMLQSTASEDLNLDFLISILTNDIFEKITEHFVIVLDDYHLLKSDQQIDRFLSDFIQRSDDNCHLAITSRKLLTLPDMPLMVARSQVGGLSIEELAFIPEEVQALFNHIYGKSINHSQAERITSQSEGWITGLLLTNQMSNKGLGEPIKIARASGIGLYEYLAEQVLDQQPRKVRQFLLYTSLLEEFDADMCELILSDLMKDPPNWQAMMNQVVQSNLFILPLDEEFRWLRYHHLFRDFLQNRIRMEQPEFVPEIQLKMAEYFLVKKDWDRVVEIYSSLGRIDRIANLLKEVGSVLLSRGQITKLAEWLGILPKDMSESDAYFQSLIAAVTVNQGAIQQGKQILDNVIAKLQEKGEQKILAQNLIRRSSALRVLGDYVGAITDAEAAIEIIEKIKGKTNGFKSEAYRAKGAALYQTGRLTKGLKYLESALSFSKSNQQDEDTARILVEIGAVNETLGNYSRAQQAYHLSLNYWESVGDSTWISTILNNLGVLQHSTGDFEASFRSLEKSMHYSNITGNQRMEGYSLASIGDLYRDIHALDEAANAYQNSIEISQRIGDQFLILYLKTAFSRLYIMQKDFSKAEIQLTTAEALAQKSGSLYEENKCYLERSALELAKAKFQSAENFLSLAEKYFSKQGHIEEYLRGKIIRLITTAKLNKTEYFKEQVEEILKDVENPINNLPIMVAISEFGNYLDDLSQHSNNSEDIIKLFAQHARFQKNITKVRRNLRKHATVVPFTSTPLKIIAFGKAEVILNGKSLVLADWKTQTSRDLFFLYLAHPEGLTKEEVGVVFWPDSNAAELKLRFKNAMYRMRHAVGSETVLFHDGYYQFNRSLEYEYDVQNFLDLTEKAETAKTTQEKRETFLQAVEQYQGLYLPEINETWVVADRQRYLNLLIQSIEQLIDLLMKNKEFDLAISQVEKALLHDHCNESIHRMAMSIFARLGNKAAIARQFETCNDILESELGTEPSPQTRNHYEILMGQV